MTSVSSLAKAPVNWHGPIREANAARIKALFVMLLLPGTGQIPVKGPDAVVAARISIVFARLRNKLKWFWVNDTHQAKAFGWCCRARQFSGPRGQGEIGRAHV